MKTLLALALLLPSLSQAAVLRSAHYSRATRSVVVDLGYGGGCREHRFVLRGGLCQQSFPLRCLYGVVDQTRNDFCRAFVFKRVSFRLRDYGLDKPAFRGAVLVLRGDGRSSVSVQLP